MPGACAGEFLLGANGVLRLADGRGRPSGCKGSFLMSIRQFAMCSAQETANSRSCVVVRGQKKARATADVIHINSSIISTPSKKPGNPWRLSGFLICRANRFVWRYALIFRLPPLKKGFPGCRPPAERCHSHLRQRGGRWLGKVSQGEAWRGVPLLKRPTPPRSSPSVGIFSGGASKVFYGYCLGKRV